MLLYWPTFFVQLLCAYFPCNPKFGDPIPLIQVKPNRRELSYFSFNPNPVVETHSGFVRGFIKTTIKGRKVAAFSSIPFGEPPMGELRFRAPVPKRPWLGILNVIKPKPLCLQMDASYFYNVRGTEDCLYLSVYTPRLPHNRADGHKLPVMIYIFGGAFFFGTGNFGPAYLLDKDVILVTLNYRLGPLGFLATGDEASPGNFGLKDQALAIEWVHKNIENFGGDKRKITLFGQSAGAGSVHMHMMSERTKHLFQRAILHSGSAFNHWVINDVTPSLGVRLAEVMNCPTNSSFLMVDCLREKDPVWVVAEQVKLWEWMYFPLILFSAVVEPPSLEAFITERPADLYAKGKVAKIPILAGIVQNEGELCGFIISHVPGSLRPPINQDWNRLAPSIFDYTNRVSATRGKIISMKIKEYYMGNLPFNPFTQDLFHNACGDRYFVTGVHKALQQHTIYGQPTYAFLFSHRPEFGHAASLGYRQEEWGVSHTDDVMFLMNNTSWYRPLKLQTTDYAVAEFVINVWTNFATKGRPLFTNEKGRNVNFWNPIVDASNMKYLDISTTGPKMIQEPFFDRIKFWESLKIEQFIEPSVASPPVVTVQTSDNLLQFI